MRKLTAAFVALLFVLVPVLARAEPLNGGQIQARASGGEFRGYGATSRARNEDMIWRLRADGSAASFSTLRRATAQTGGYSEDYTDIGTWRIDGNRLCVEFRAAHAALSGCYVVDSTGGDQVHLDGPLHFQGTLSR